MRMNRRFTSIMGRRPARQDRVPASQCRALRDGSRLGILGAGRALRAGLENGHWGGRASPRAPTFAFSQGYLGSRGRSPSLAWIIKRALRLWLGSVCCLLAAGLGPALPAQAQPYSLDWYKISGGGGTSTGAQYSVSATIGQPDAGSMSGGRYTLEGGFWGVIAAVQTPGAPRLTITLNAPSTTVTLSWPSPSTGFGLQANTNLMTTNWSAVAQSPSDDSTFKTVTVPVGPGNWFYRLKQ